MSPKDDAGEAVGDAGFRRDAAHALSTPLGSLLLQAEMIDYQLREGRVPQARQAVAHLLADFDGFAQMMRATFLAMADMAETGAGTSDPVECFTEALAELGDDTVRVLYEGPSPPLALPRPALVALLRRVASESARLGLTDGTLLARQGETSLRLSLKGQGLSLPDMHANPFSQNGSLSLWTAREILTRFGGRLLMEDEPGVSFTLQLPLA